MCRLLCLSLILIALVVCVSAATNGQAIPVPNAPVGSKAYALWLTPRDDDPFLGKTITELAHQFGTKLYDPHVTLCTGTWDGTQESLERLKKKIDLLSRNLQSVSLTAWNIQHKNTPFQYLYVKLIDNDQDVLEKVKNVMTGDVIELPPIGLHTSLLYSVHQDESVPHLNIDQPELERKYFPLLPVQIQFDTIKLIIPDSGSFDKVDDWKTECAVKLKPLPVAVITSKSQMFRIIIAGGQTGVDQAALLAALVSNLLCAGWCPPDRKCETLTGPVSIPNRFPLLPTPVEKSEKKDIPRSLRTEWNVQASEGTLFIKPISGASPKWPEDADPGTSWTLEAVKCIYKRRYCVVDVADESKFPSEINSSFR